MAYTEVDGALRESGIDHGEGAVWLRHAFMIPFSAWSANTSLRYGAGRDRRYSTSAAFKYTNTTLGGNWCINNPPQYNYNTDVPLAGLGRHNDEWEHGMGIFYSEAHDDPKQIIHMSMGVPKFSSWFSFFTNFYDRNAALLANTGRVSDIWYKLGYAGGMVVTLPLQPLIIGMSVMSRLWAFLNKQQPSKWYYFDPTMHSYWSAVNVMANEFAVGLGLVERVFPDEQFSESNPVSPGQTVTEAQRTSLYDQFPDIFRKEGGVDIYALANRTQRIANRSQIALRSLREQATSIEQLDEMMAAYLTKDENGTPNYPLNDGALEDDTDGLSYFNRAIAVRMKGRDGRDSLASDSFTSWTDDYENSIYNFIVGSQRDASQFVSFRVDHNGSVSESFSNSVRDSDIAQTLNTQMGVGRSKTFDFMGGNVIQGVGEVINSVQSAIAGALDSVKLSGLATLTGTAFADIPKLWDGSTASLPRADYTIPLPSPYGNKISRFKDLYIPLAMILATGLPLSAGRSAYTSPFICQIYHQGRVQKQLAMVDSITINRGTGTVGWNAENEMLGLEVTISVIDLSNLITLPIKGGFSSPNDLAANVMTTATGGIASLFGLSETEQEGVEAATMFVTNSAVWDEQSMFSDYMAVLTSLPVSESYYVGKRLNLNLTRAMTEYRAWKSPTRLASWLLDLGIARTISAGAQTSSRF